VQGIGRDAVGILVRSALGFAGSLALIMRHFHDLGIAWRIVEA